jgi:hypothetical protein
MRIVPTLLTGIAALLASAAGAAGFSVLVDVYRDLKYLVSLP